MSAQVSTAQVWMEGTVFLTKPLRTLPGPISTIRSTPSSAIRRMVSSM